MLTNWRQGFLCHHTVSMEHVADRTAVAAVDKYFSLPTENNFCSSLPMDTGIIIIIMQCLTRHVSVIRMTNRRHE